MAEKDGDRLDNALAALDNWYDDALKSGAGFKNEEEKQAYIKSLGDPEKHPMFATTTEDLEGNPLVEALRALREEDKTNIELAIMYKDEGNEWMKKTDKKSIHEAYDRYTHALSFIEKAKQEQTTAENNNSTTNLPLLTSQIYSNRAQTSLLLGNYGSCRKDCEESLKIWPENMKSYYRLAKAHYALKHYELCMQTCTQALTYIDSQHIQHKDLRLLLGKAEKDYMKLSQQKNATLEKNWSALVSTWDHVWSLAQELSVTLGYSRLSSPDPAQLHWVWPCDGSQPLPPVPGTEADSTAASTTAAQPPAAPSRAPATSAVMVDKTTIQWPIIFHYPQYQNKFDIIPDVQLSCMLAEYLVNIFPEPEEEEERVARQAMGAPPRPPPVTWDVENEYHASNLVVYLAMEISQPCFTKQAWYEACLEYHAIVQNGNLDVINYGLQKKLQSSTSSSTTATTVTAAANSSNTISSLEDMIKHQERREAAYHANHHQQQKGAKAAGIYHYYDVHVGCSIETILKAKKNILARGVLSLFIFPRGSKAHKKFLKTNQENKVVILPLNP